MDSSITAYFGGDTSGLQNATQEASIMMKGFSTQAGRAMSEIGSGFIGAVVFMEAIKGIKDFSDAAMDAADAEQQASEITGNAISDQGQAWLDTQAVVSGTGSTFKDVGMMLVSIPGMAGEAVGTLIDDVRGISPAWQQQYQQMSNQTTATLATIKAAHDKFMTDLPAEMAKMNEQLVALDKQYAASQTDSQDSVNDLTDQYNAILAQEVATNQVISTQEDAGLDTSGARKELLTEQVALMQTAVALQAAQTQATRDEIQAATDDYKERADSMTVQQQITALVGQQVYYENQIGAATNTSAQNKLLANAAASLATQIASKEDAYQKSIALSAADQLAMFNYQAGTLTGINSISADQYKVLVLQSAEKKAQVDLDAQLAIYEQTKSAAAAAQLVVLQQQKAVLDQNLATAVAEVAADNADVTAINAQTAAETQKGAAAAAAAAAAAGPVGAEGDPDSGSVSGGGPGTLDTYTNTGQEAQYISNTVRNVKANLLAIIQGLQDQMNALEGADSDPNASAEIKAIEDKINTLHAQYINVSASDIFGNNLTPAPISTTQGNQQLQQASNDTLTTISGQLDQIIGPSKG
jgi:hypothetical protein